jgi:putative transposase
MFQIIGAGPAGLAGPSRSRARAEASLCTKRAQSRREQYRQRDVTCNHVDCSCIWCRYGGAVQAAYQAGSPKLAQLVARYEREYPSATACFLDDFEACIAHLQLPIAHRRATRTTNMLERLFGEERRRTKVIPHAFGERAVLKLMYAALIRASETWKRIVISEFELKQLESLREHLNRVHAERTAPVKLSASRSRISSNSRT